MFVAQPEDIAAQQAKVDRRANAHDAAKQAKIADMKVPARPRASLAISARSPLSSGSAPADARRCAGRLR